MSDAPHDARVVRLDNAAAVDQLLATRAYLRVFMPRLQIAPESLDAETASALQARVDRLADECGCGVGSAAAIAALGASIAYVIAAPPLGVWGTIWRCALATFAGATIGKLAGVARARLELHGVLVQLRETLATEL